MCQPLGDGSHDFYKPRRSSLHRHFIYIVWVYVDLCRIQAGVNQMGVGCSEAEESFRVGLRKKSLHKATGDMEMTLKTPDELTQFILVGIIPVSRP